MFELPEYLTLAGQLSDTVTGKRIEEGLLGNSPHKFVQKYHLAIKFSDGSALSAMTRMWGAMEL